MSAPDVTALVFVCNRTRYLAEAIASVRAQTVSPARLIVSDASDDAAARAAIDAIVAQANATPAAPTSPTPTTTPVSPAQPRVELLRPPQRLRQVAHLRWGLTHVRTAFAAVLDDDDVWLPHHLAQTAGWLERDACHGLAVSNSIRIRADGTRDQPTNPTDRELFPPEAPRRWLEFLVRSPFSSTSGYVFRPAALTRALWHEGSAVDSLLAVSVLLAGYRYRGVAAPGFLYRVHDGSFYTGGVRDFLRDRHAWRWWALRHDGLRFTRRLPTFPLVALKSAWWLWRHPKSSR